MELANTWLLSRTAIAILAELNSSLANKISNL